MSYIKDKLKKKSEGKEKDKKKGSFVETMKKAEKVDDDDDDDGEEYYLGKEDKMAEKRRLEEIRKEYRQLKRSMKAETKERVDEKEV